MGITFVHPNDDDRVIEGNATIGIEIVEDESFKGSADYLFIPLGGGGLAAGVSS